MPTLCRARAFGAPGGLSLPKPCSPAPDGDTRAGHASGAGCARQGGTASPLPSRVTRSPGSHFDRAITPCAAREHGARLGTRAARVSPAPGRRAGRRTMAHAPRRAPRGARCAGGVRARPPSRAQETTYASLPFSLPNTPAASRWHAPRSHPLRGVALRSPPRPATRRFVQAAGPTGGAIHRRPLRFRGAPRRRGRRRVPRRARRRRRAPPAGSRARGVSRGATRWRAGHA